MGFLQVVNGNEMDAEKLARFWGDTSQARIENGGRVIIRENEFLIQLSGDRIADVITEAGGYIYHSNIGTNPDKEAYAKVFAEFAERHSGFFGNKEIVILSDSRKITSADQFRRVLLELAGENVQSPAPSIQPPPVIPSETEETWICGKCGTENKFIYCKNCGASRTSNSEIYTEPKPSQIPVSEPKTTAPPIVPSKSEEMWICGDCGTKNKFSYCKNCGASRKPDSEIYTEPKPSYIPVSEPKTVEPPPIIPSKSGEIWVCGDCGTKNKFSYCKSCGASRSPDSEIYTEPKPSYIPVSEPKTVEPPPIVPSKSGEIWICGDCGTKNKFSYCKNCGASRSPDSEIYTEPKPTYTFVPQMEEDVWICKCGTKNKFSFCKNCGSSRPKNY